MKKIVLLAVLSAISFVALADQNNLEPQQIESLQTGRYTHVKNIPLADQLNPLKVVIKTRIPQSVTTIRETVQFLLARSGYALAGNDVLSYEAQSLLELPLPYVHRNIGPMTLDRVLHTLSGESFELVVDPVHRKIAYELSARLTRSM
jgi:conjugative transfer region protein (TIGR03748 family)